MKGGRCPWCGEVAFSPGGEPLAASAAQPLSDADARAATPAAAPEKLRVSTPFYLVSCLGSYLAGCAWLSLYDQVPGGPQAWRQAMPLLGLAILLYGGIIGGVLIHRMWAAIQVDTDADIVTTTPDRAVAFLFVPVFNLYWAFRVFWGWTQDYNRLTEWLRIDRPRRMPEDLGLLCSFMTAAGGIYAGLAGAGVVPVPKGYVLPLVIAAVNTLVWGIFLAAACGGINALPALPRKTLRAAAVARDSLVLGLLGFVTAGISAIGGLVLGIVALGNAKKSTPSQGKRRAIAALALVGLVVSTAGLVIPPVVLARMIYATQVEARKLMLMNQAHIVCMELQSYQMNTIRGTFPAADQWPDVLGRAFGRKVDVDKELPSPFQPEAGCALAMNRYLSQLDENKVLDRTRTVLLFEVKPGGPRSGGPELLPDDPPAGRYVIAFVDGHVQWLTKEEVHALIWDPQARPATPDS